MAVAATPAPKSRSSARGQWSLSHLGPFLTTWWSQQSIINFSESQLRASNKTHDFLALMASALTDNDWHVDILWDFAPMLLRKGANIWQPRVPKRAWNSHPQMLHREIYAHVPKVGNLPCWVSPLVLQPIPYKKTARGIDSDMKHLDIGWFGILAFSFPSMVEITSANILHHCLYSLSSINWWSRFSPTVSDLPAAMSFLFWICI